MQQLCPYLNPKRSPLHFFVTVPLALHLVFPLAALFILIQLLTATLVIVEINTTSAFNPFQMSFLNPITLSTLLSFSLSRILGVLYKTLAEVSENEEKADLLMKAEEALQDAYSLRIEMTGGYVRGVD